MERPAQPAAPAPVAAGVAETMEAPAPSQPPAPPSPPAPPPAATPADLSAGAGVPDRDAPRDDAPVATPAPPSVDPIYGSGWDEASLPTRRPRRNPARYWTMAAVAFALIAAAIAGALWYFGPPGWAVNLGLMAQREEPQLVFSLPRPPERRKLPTGQEFFAFSGRVINGSDRELTVPAIVVELRDEQGRLVFSWMTRADKERLKPNEEARISESRLDIPANARNLSLKFVDSGM